MLILTQKAQVSGKIALSAVLILPWCQGLQTKRMKGITEFPGKDPVNQTLPVKTGLSGKNLRDNLNTEMRLALGPTTRMARMGSGFIHNFQPQWLKGILKSGGNSFPARR